MNLYEKAMFSSVVDRVINANQLLNKNVINNFRSSSPFTDLKAIVLHNLTSEAQLRLCNSVAKSILLVIDNYAKCKNYSYIINNYVMSSVVSSLEVCFYDDRFKQHSVQQSFFKLLQDSIGKLYGSKFVKYVEIRFDDQAFGTKVIILVENIVSNITLPISFYQLLINKLINFLNVAVANTNKRAMVTKSNQPIFLEIIQNFSQLTYDNVLYALISSAMIKINGRYFVNLEVIISTYTIKLNCFESNRHTLNNLGYSFSRLPFACSIELGCIGISSSRDTLSFQKFFNQFVKAIRMSC